MAEPARQVYYKTGLSYDQPEALARSVEEIFRLCPAAERLGPGSRVLLKPNLLAKHPPEHAVTTHPAVVEAVAAALRRRGVEQIVLADSCGGLYSEGVMRGIYKASGLSAVCGRLGITVWDKTTSGPRASSFSIVVHIFIFIIW